jgi:hypothetical protein
MEWIGEASDPICGLGGSQKLADDDEDEDDDEVEEYESDWSDSTEILDEVFNVRDGAVCDEEETGDEKYFLQHV